MPLFEVNGSTGATAFKHSGPICVNTGTICVAIAISMVVPLAHCPTFGVNVYVVVPVVEVLIVDGFQVPAIPLFDVPGNIGAVAF